MVRGQTRQEPGEPLLWSRTSASSKVIGLAARKGSYDLQALERVWYYLARFGQRSGENQGS